MRISDLFRPVILLVLLFIANSVLATGMTGSVVDKENGDELIGVDVVLIGTGMRSQTDIDGNFAFDDLAPGTYEIRVTYLGYNASIMGGIQVGSGQTPHVKVQLDSFKAHDGGELVVSGTRIMSTETALLAERKQSLSIGDGISAAQISQSPDGTGGEALKRVTGLTVTDGKYVIVRGMPDRYNVTHLDGIPVTGTDVTRDRKSFSFDMIPANLLANLQVVKSVTPDMPGDVTGGLVVVNTLEFPEKATTSLSLSAGHIGDSTGEDFVEDATLGSDDWKAKDDGGRGLPEFENKNDLARALPNRWTTSTRTADPKTSFSASHGNKIRLAGLDIGYVGALNYRNKFDVTDQEEHRQGYEDIFLAGARSQRKVLWGGLGNLFVRLSENHKLGIRTVYTRSSESEVHEAEGYDSDTEFVRTNIRWQERYNLSQQLTGIHKLDRLMSGLDFGWMAYRTEAEALEPDNRFVEYNVDNLEGQVPTMSFNRRSWTTLADQKDGHGLDLTYSFAEFDFEEEYAVKLKVGMAHDDLERTYNIDNWYSDTTFSAASRALRQLPIDQIFAPENYNEIDDDRRGSGLNFKQELAMSGDYDASHELDSYYAMAVVPFTLFKEELQLVGGVRVEDSNQQVLAVYLPEEEAYVDSSQIQIQDTLPSLNLTWNYDVDLNVRLAYYESVNRPEFREMAPVTRRNYATLQNEQGNADLTRAYVKNYDARVEFYPRAGELISAGYFRKTIIDPIEESLTPTAEGPLLSWVNSPEARNHGFEIELRRRLDFFPLTRHFYAQLNYTRVYSEVEFYDQYDGVNSIRPLQGQAPWVLNVSLKFKQERLGLTFNALYFKKGQSLSSVGDNRDYDVYQEPRDVVDFVVVKSFGKNMKAKLAVTNVFNTEAEFSSGHETESYIYSSVHDGREVNLSVSARF